MNSGLACHGAFSAQTSSISDVFTFVQEPPPVPPMPAAEMPPPVPPPPEEEFPEIEANQPIAAAAKELHEEAKKWESTVSVFVLHSSTHFI